MLGIHWLDLGITKTAFFWRTLMGGMFFKVLAVMWGDLRRTTYYE